MIFLLFCCQLVFKEKKSSSWRPIMSFFNGDFRRKPGVNLGGATKKIAKDELLKQAALERQLRQEERHKQKSILIVQSLSRGWLSRKRFRQDLRKTFDSKSNPSDEETRQMLGLIPLFFQREEDASRVTNFGQTVIKKKDYIAKQIITSSDEVLIHRINKFIWLNLDLLSSPSPDISITIPLRAIEVFTDPSLYQTYCRDVNESKRIVSLMWLKVLNSKFFKVMKILLENKTPEPMEEQSKAATPLAESLMSLVFQSLDQDYPPDQVSAVVIRLLTELLAGPFSAQVKYFVMPCLVSKCGLLRVLEPTVIVNAFLDGIDSKTIEPLLWNLFTCLKLISQCVCRMSVPDKLKYVHVLRSLSIALPSMKVSNGDSDEENEDSDSEDFEETMDDTDHPWKDYRTIISEIYELVNESSHVNGLTSLMEDSLVSEEAIIDLTCLCYSLLCSAPLAVNRCRLLYSLAFRTKFLRLLWSYISQVSTPSVFGSPTPLLNILARGLPLAAVSWEHILPQLTLFCSLLSYVLPTVDDVEFYETSPEKDPALISHMPFTLKELQTMTMTLKDVCIGLIELAYQDTKVSVKSDYEQAMKSVAEDDPRASATEVTNNPPNVAVWLKLFKTSVHLLRQLHHRDSRRAFCPVSHWLSSVVHIPVERPTNFRVGNVQRRRYQQFVGLRRLTREELDAGGPPPSTTEVKNITILQEIPFVVSFVDRFKIFQSLVMRDKEDSRGNAHNFMIPGSTIDINIRRNYIYEDAFEKLSMENEPSLKKLIRVQLMNVVGLDEAGIDGGGIFREFLSQLLKTAFDPNRGFFQSTQHNRLIYPNPAARVVNEDFAKHFYFIGRMLGKAMYENMLIELPFATFFLAKLLAKGSTSDVDIHHLSTLDPTMYKSLVFLKNYDPERIPDLGLDFTVTNAEFGENEEIELKPGGKNMQVTASNRIEYIHLMADYRLNKQIRVHCAAFKQGMANVIDLDWIRMFSPKELQTLISGTQNPIDIQDLKVHTKYSGGYDIDHPVIKCFWNVVTEFSEEQKRLLLKFVTSCSRPPLLGFKDLYPPFSVHFAGRDDRLPTASTCMNLLKLPEFQEKETLRSKLLYAIESGVGFELS